MTDWPKLDPITGRKICSSCWNGTHRRKNVKGEMVDACNGDCHCVHLSEQAFAAMERKKSRENRREFRKNQQAQLEDSTNPLQAVNDKFKASFKGKTHA